MESVISFDSWWMLLSKQRKLKPHLKEIIWADFQARGLTDYAPKTQYDEALVKFGL